MSVVELPDCVARSAFVYSGVAASTLDGLVLEAIAFRPDGKLHPFQTTMRRFGRRLNVETLQQELPLSPFFFDLLFLDGQSLYSG